MASPNERTVITLDYLTGKRRAEKALGFLTGVGPLLLACDPPEQLARTVADHVTRLDIAVCLLELRPHTGAPLSVTAQAPDLEHEMPHADEIVAQCRKVAERLAEPNVRPPRRSDTTAEIGDAALVVRDELKVAGVGRPRVCDDPIAAC
jgi:hypothetical protein